MPTTHARRPPSPRRYQVTPCVGVIGSLKGVTYYELLDTRTGLNCGDGWLTKADAQRVANDWNRGHFHP